MSLVHATHRKAAELGKHVVRMTTRAGSGHPSSALSIGHLVVSLMYKQMRFDPSNPWNRRNDRLVLSEGHAVPAVYAAYADLQGAVGSSPADARKLTVDDLATLRELDSVLDGHPNPAEGFPFFDGATGSLGQGVSLAAGLGLAARLATSDRRIFVLIGDGESREGQIWEAIDFLIDFKLVNVVPIFNCNGQGQADYVSPQQSAEKLEAKLRAFGCRVAVIDGHDPDAIDRALASAADGEMPLAIVARTEKGWGVSALKAQSNHGKPLPADQVAEACAELDAIAARHPADGEQLAPAAPTGAADTPKTGIRVTLPAYSAALEQAGLGGKTKLATRRAYGVALAALGRADDRIVALDGDVSNSTFANFFAKQFPKRFFECKIAEQNMISVAAGLAAAGCIPFASSFAKFLARAYDQIEMAHITRANIKIVGSHAGVSLGADGPSQMGVVDVAYFRTFTRADDGTGRPACVSFEPSDAMAAYRLTELMANHTGLCYMRTHRPDVPRLYDDNTEFSIGGSHKLRDGGDALLVSSGYMVHVAAEAAERLAADGIQCSLFDAYSFPLDAGPILAAAASAGGVIVAVEDNYGGGVTGALAEAAARTAQIKVHPLHCRRIPKSGKSPQDVLRLVGVAVEDIVAKVKQAVPRAARA